MRVQVLEAAYFSVNLLGFEILLLGLLLRRLQEVGQRPVRNRLFPVENSWQKVWQRHW